MITHTYSWGNETEVLVWNVETLWKAATNLPIQVVALSEAVKHLDSVNWAYSQPRPGVWNDVLHAKRILETDLAYPIILSAEGRLMDGAHRLAKAWILGQETVKIVQFEADPEPDERRPRGDELRPRGDERRPREQESST